MKNYQKHSPLLKMMLPIKGEKLKKTLLLDLKMRKEIIDNLNTCAVTRFDYPAVFYRFELDLKSNELNCQFIASSGAATSNLDFIKRY